MSYIHDTHKTSSDWGLKYRPEKLEELILPKRYLTMFKKMIKSGEISNMLFCGEFGCGKTSLALILSDALDYQTLYINMSLDTSVEVLRNDIKNFGNTVAMNSKRKLIIADECEKASDSLKKGLKAEIEQLSENVSFIFITNYASQLEGGFHSRLQKVEFIFTPEEIKQMKTAYYKRALEILDHNEKEYDKKAIGQVVDKFFPDFRRILNTLQCFSMQGKITEELVQTSVSVNIDEFFSILKRKKYKELRQFIANLSIQPQYFYSEIFKHIDNHLDKTILCESILILSKYSYESAFVSDHELNLCACAMELMLIQK